MRDPVPSGSSPVAAIVSNFYFSDSNRWVHGHGFNLHFHNDYLHSSLIAAITNHPDFGILKQQKDLLF